MSLTGIWYFKGIVKIDYQLQTVPSEQGEVSGQTNVATGACPICTAKCRTFCICKEEELKKNQ